MTANVSPVAWYGGKSRLSAWIVTLLPRHDTYIEAFGGGASVLFSKSRARLEVYNDLDAGLVTFFRVLRDRPAELQHALMLTPYARAEFEHCRNTWAGVDDELERARRWYVRTRMAFACSATEGWGYEVNGAQRGGTRARSFATAIENLPDSPSASGASRSTSSTGRNASTATTDRAQCSTSTRPTTPKPGDVIAATVTDTTSTPPDMSGCSREPWSCVRRC